MLSGQLCSQVWLRTRSVFVPKKNGSPRPLGIGYYASIDEEAGVINKGGMVLDSEGESILNSENSRLKANGVQEGTKGFPLLAPSGHVGNELPLAEERRGAAVGVLEPMKQLGGEHNQTGVDEASRDSVETILIIQREEDKVVLGVED